MSERSLPRNASVVCRMEHEGMVAAIALVEDGVSRCVGIVAPGYSLGGQWSVIEQTGIDPHDACSGVSSVNGYETEAAALAAFEILVAEHSDATIQLPGFVIGAPTKRGEKVAYVAHAFGGGTEGFTEYPGGASVAWTANHAKRLLEAAQAPSMRSYHGSDQISMTEFSVYEVMFEVQTVDLRGVDTGAVGDVVPPSGWRFAVANRLRSSFRAPDRHWAQCVNVDEASPFQTLGEAMVSAERSEMEVVLVKRSIGAVPLASLDIEASINDERRLVDPEIVPVADIGGQAWRPRR